MAAAAVLKKNRHYLGNGWPIATKFGTLPQFDPFDRIPTAAASMQPICAVMNFLTDSLEHVGCRTFVIGLFLFFE